MHKTISILIAILSINYFGCKDSVNESKQVITNDIIADSSYLTVTGGDPRGNYTPNSPFVFTFASTDTFVSKTGIGTLQIHGATSTSGNFSLILTTKVSGSAGMIIFASSATPETTNGNWAINGTQLLLSVAGNNESIPFTSNSKGLYLVSPYFSPVPPLSSRNVDYRPLNYHSTIWAFKK